MRERRSSFWLPMTLQTVALLVAANANQLADAAPYAKSYAEPDATYLFDASDDAFVYKPDSFQQPESFVVSDVAWVDGRQQMAFDYPVLLDQNDRLLLGALDHYNGAGQGGTAGQDNDDDWLIGY